MSLKAILRSQLMGLKVRPSPPYGSAPPERLHNTMRPAGVTRASVAQPPDLVACRFCGRGLVVGETACEGCGAPVEGTPARAAKGRAA